MSPVSFVSVIDFLMSPAQDTAHDGAGFVVFLVVLKKIFFLIFSNSRSN